MDREKLREIEREWVRCAGKYRKGEFPLTSTDGLELVRVLLADPAPEPVAKAAVGDRDAAYEAWKLNGRLGALDHRGGFDQGWKAALATPRPAAQAVTAEMVEKAVRSLCGTAGKHIYTAFRNDAMLEVAVTDALTAALAARQEGEP